MKNLPNNKSTRQEYGITDPEGKPFEVPAQGSVALLALGYRGLMAWRAKKIDAQENPQQEKSDAGNE